jgi:hypothetical protein
MTEGAIGETYILAGPSMTYAEVLNLVARLAGTKPPVLIPPGLARVAARMTAPVELGWSACPVEEGMAETVASIRASGSG